MHPDMKTQMTSQPLAALLQPTPTLLPNTLIPLFVTSVSPSLGKADGCKRVWKVHIAEMQ